MSATKIDTYPTVGLPSGTHNLTVEITDLFKSAACVQAHFDGACEPFNPGGHGSCAAVISVGETTAFRATRYLGQRPSMTNNVAEYLGVILLLNELEKLYSAIALPPAIIRGDSQLVINQLRGKWRAGRGAYLPYYRIAKQLVDNLQGQISFEWIRREQNEECDSLSKKALLEAGVKPRRR